MFTDITPTAPGSEDPADSISPSGERFAVPSPDQYAAEMARLRTLAATSRAEGREVVVVMGLGFVGAVMAAIIADARDAQGRPTKFVIGCQRPSARSYWKIPIINRGEPPVKAEDPEVAEIVARTVRQSQTLTATYHSDCLQLADVVVVDVQCDLVKPELGNVQAGTVDMDAFVSTVETIGDQIPPGCLVLIETTVAPGTTELIAWPILKRAFERRGLDAVPLLAHSFERVMPGRHYVASIRDFWRVCAGCDRPARVRAEQFLRQVLNTAEFELTVMDRPIESETTKILENTYRATVLALMDEWCLFAERTGVDLTKVIEAIRRRPTHSNILFPGPGIGGYCLPKDGGLGYWAYGNVLGFDDGDQVFQLTPAAININDRRALHAADLVAEALAAMGTPVTDAAVLLCGASYRPDVADTRYSGSELVIRSLADRGARMRVHDPYVTQWPELADQENYPAPGLSWKRFFLNQEPLAQLLVEQDLGAALAGVDAMVLAVPHQPYLHLRPDQVVGWAGQPLAVVDCYGILSDHEIRRYLELGCAVRGLGRGHIRFIEQDVRQTRQGG